MFAVAAAGFGATAHGIVPHRSPAPSLPRADQPHDFPDLEALLPPVVAGRAAELRSSFDGTVVADDETIYGGAYTALSLELAPSAGPDRLDELEMAQEFLPGRGTSDWVSVTAYRYPGRTAAGWRPTLDALVANRVPDAIWLFRRETIDGRQVVVGVDERGRPGDWIRLTRDVLVEVRGTDGPTVRAIISALP